MTAGRLAGEKTMARIAIEIAAGQYDARSIDGWAESEIQTNPSPDPVVFELLSVDDEFKRELFRNLVRDTYRLDVTATENHPEVQQYLLECCRAFLRGDLTVGRVCRVAKALYPLFETAGNIPAGLVTLYDTCTALDCSWYDLPDTFERAVRNATGELESTEPTK